MKSDSDENNQLNDKLEDAAKTVKYGASIRTLVDVLKKYDESLDQAIQEAAATIASNNRDHKDPEDEAAAAYSCLETFLGRADSYFAAEAECKDFLVKRIATSKQEAIDLVSADRILWLYGTVSFDFDLT